MTKEEKKIYMRKWRNDNKDKVAEYEREHRKEKMSDPNYKKKCSDSRTDKRNKRRDEIRGTILAEFQKEGCIVCHEKTPVCLVAHHLDPSIKEFNISHELTHNNNQSLAKITEELKKCICLCGNCHRKIHAGSLTLPLQFC